MRRLAGCADPFAVRVAQRSAAVLENEPVVVPVAPLAFDRFEQCPEIPGQELALSSRSRQWARVVVRVVQAAYSGLIVTLSIVEKHRRWQDLRTKEVVRY